ncbi:MAG TPA: HEPN domain-containing protein [Actinomycetes bacterium]
MTHPAGLDRSREELEAAQLLADKGYSAQAVSRAYFATFYAAEAALLVIGETRSKHSGVISAFIHLLVRTGQVDEEIGRLLRSLFERRNQADYAPVGVPVEEAAATIRDAERVVRAVEAWLALHR